MEGQCSSTADSRQRTTSGGGSVSTSQQHLRQGSRSAGRAQKRSADELDGEYADSATSRARRWRKNRVTASLPSQGALDAAQVRVIMLHTPHPSSCPHSEPLSTLIDR